MLNRSTLATLLALMLFLLLLVLLAQKVLQLPWLEPESLALRVESASPSMLLLWFFGGVLFASIGLPRQLLAFVCGYVYGVGSGLVISLVIAIGGCIVAFQVARLWLREPVSIRFPAMLGLIEKFVAEDAFGRILVLRLQPLGTNLVTNLCAGVSGIRALTFFASSGLGYVPQMLVFTLAGSGLRIGSTTQLFVSAGLLVVSLILGVYLYRRYQQRDDPD